jgi:hypothetical protein
LTGEGRDVNGFAVTLDARARVTLSGAGTATFAEVDPGPHRISLTGVDSRCAVSPGLERDLQTAAEETARVDFVLACAAVSGVIRIVTTTSGSDVDPDGYQVLLDDEPRLRVSSAGVHQLTASEGSHRITLTDLSGNCALTGDVTGNLQVAAGEVTEIAFAIECTAVPRAGPGREIAFVHERGPDSLPVRAVFVMNDEGTQVHLLSDTLSGEHTSPAWSPDGGLIAIVASTPNLAPAITLATANGEMVRQLRMEHLVFFSSELSWSPEATRIFFTGHDEGCAPVYQAHADGSGEALALSDEQCPDDILSFAYSPDGTHLSYLRACFSCNIPATQLVVRSATTLQSIELPCFLPGFSNGAAWSPDGQKLAVDAQSQRAEDLFGSEIWIMDLDLGTCIQITSGVKNGFSPSWSPDGSRIAFVSTRDGNPEIYVMNADGSGQRRLTSNTVYDGQPAWRP